MIFTVKISFSEIPPQEQIYRDIMANYVKSTPVHNFLKVITVNTSFRLYQILSLVNTHLLINHTLIL